MACIRFVNITLKKRDNAASQILSKMISAKMSGQVNKKRQLSLLSKTLGAAAHFESSRGEPSPAILSLPSAMQLPGRD